MSSSIQDLGEITSMAATTQEDLKSVLENTPLNYGVDSSPIFDGNGERIYGFKRIFRPDTGRTFAVTKPGYVIIDNVTAFTSLYPLWEAYPSAKVTQAVVTRGGARAFLTIDAGKELIIGDDEYRLKFIGKNSHDGTSSLTFMVGLYRLVCSNGLVIAKNQSVFRIKHTQSAPTILAMTESMFRLVDKSLEHIVTQLEFLQKMSVNSTYLRQALEKIVPGDPEKSARVRNKRNRIEELFRHGRGNHGRTRYDLLNAVTEYVDHETGSRSPDRAYEYAVTGTGQRLKETALKVLTA